MSIFAGATVYWYWEKLHERRYRTLALPSILLLLLVSFSLYDIEWLRAHNTHEVLFRSAYEYEQKGEYDKAIADYSEIIRASPVTYGAQFGLGEVYMKTGIPHSAIEHYKMALVALPVSALARYKLGLAYIYAGAYDDAIKEFNSSIELTPAQSSSYYGLAVAYDNKGLSDKALIYWKEYLKREPKGEWAGQALAGIEKIQEESQ